MVKKRLLALFGDSSKNNNLSHISKELNIPRERLSYYQSENIIPIGEDLDKISKFLKIDKFKVIADLSIINFESIFESIVQNKKQVKLSPKYSTKLGHLYQGDCIPFMRSLNSEKFDLIFADPPFNLKKIYPSDINDNLKKEEYLKWSIQWILECTRLLKHGGSLYIWNLPKWNSYISFYLNQFLTFQHWIAVDIKYTLPIARRYYPSHYSLLYYTKGPRAKTFHPDRIPMKVCPKCMADLVDYGGYKDKMNPRGVNLSDVWYDIAPVRHSKYKRRNANELSIKLLDRIIEASSNENDHIFDPFGGAGTTYVAAEIKNRKWTGIEIGPVTDITNRFKQINIEKQIVEDYRKDFNLLFTKEIEKERLKRGLWTASTIKKPKILIDNEDSLFNTIQIK